MTSKRTLRRIALVTSVVLVVTLVALGILAFSTVRASLPERSGELKVEGLTAPVEVVRNEQGVPDIYADTPGDLFRAQGYVAAQDRFFQMDLRRHITAGRLSELVGSGGLDADRAVRTMGWRRVAEQEYPRLDPTTRQYLQAYADGVNAYLGERKHDPSKISLEYWFLLRGAPDYRIEEWTPIDSLAWLKAMAWDLRGDYNDELARAALSETVPPGLVNQLYPTYPGEEHAPILDRTDWKPITDTTNGGASAPRSKADRAAEGAAYASAGRLLAATPTLLGKGEGIGSNAWAVSGSLTSTGKPLLANDPHLGLTMPSVWMQAGLHCRTVSPSCPFNVSGFTFAGLPGIVIGHNDKVAWGFTNLAPDVTDFYLERVTGDSYERDGKQLPVTVRNETIKVAGGKDETIPVRSTVHGPIISDVIPEVRDAGNRPAVQGQRSPDLYDVSLSWTALTPGRTADAIFALNTAKDWKSFRAAAAKFEVPSQNLVYADTDGHIGYQAPGRVPVRATATQGSAPGFWPAPGWSSAYDWKGYVPFEEMPNVLDPSSGMIVTANQQVTASSEPFLTTEWDMGYRSQRIRDLLTTKTKAGQKLTVKDMSSIQMDNRNGFAPTLTAALLDIEVDDFTKQAQGLLRGWDFTQPADKSRASASAAYYNAVWRTLLAETFEELPGSLAPDGGSRWMVVMKRLLESPKNEWWDDKRTPGVIEGRDEILKRALVKARLDLAQNVGKDPATWRWGRLHTLELKHEVMGDPSVPGWVQGVFNRGGYEMPGGSSIVNANGWKANEGFQVVTGPSMRMVIDLSNLDGSVWINSTGQSGHAYGPNYEDQVEPWVAGESFPWSFGPDAVKKAGQDTLTLKPAD